MFLELLENHRTKIIQSFREAMEFKAYTQIAFLLANETAVQPNMSDRFIMGHSSYGNHLDLIDEEVAIYDLPKLFKPVIDNYLLSFVHQNQVSLFESLFFELLGIIIANQPRCLPDKKSISYGMVFESNSKEDLINIIIEKELNELKYKKVGEWFDYLCNIVNVGKVNSVELEKIVEAKATRDVLVHNSGIVNQIYIEKSGKFARFSDGEKINVSGDYTLDVWKLLSKVLVDITDAVIKKHSAKH